MSNGESKAIEDIAIWESVLACDLQNESFHPALVMGLFQSQHEGFLALQFSNGSRLEVTEDHPLFVQNKGWASFNPTASMENFGLECSKLGIGDHCVSAADGVLAAVEITQLKWRPEHQTMYVIAVENWHCFFANGILAHDEFCSRLDISLSDSSPVAPLDEF